MGHGSRLRGLRTTPTRTKPLDISHTSHRLNAQAKIIQEDHNTCPRNAVDISQGIGRRVQEGLFPGRPPYGYRHVRVNGRRLIETNETEAANVCKMFQLYAYGNCTLDGIVKRFADEGVIYRPGNPRWSRTSVHNMLNDRAYISSARFGSKMKVSGISSVPYLLPRPRMPRRIREPSVPNCNDRRLSSRPSRTGFSTCQGV